MLTQEEAQTLVKKILSYSKLPGCEIRLSSSEESFVRFANNGITTSGFTLIRDVSISTTSEDQRTGSVQLSEIDDHSLEQAVRQAEAMAAVSPADPEFVPPPGPQTYSKIDHFDEGTARTRATHMVPHVRTITEGAADKKLIAAGFLNAGAHASAVANKHGVFGYNRFTDCALSTTVRAADGLSSGWAMRNPVRFGEIDGESAGHRAIQKCLDWKGPRKLDPGKYTVVLEPAAVSDLMGRMGFNFSARSAEQGLSFLSKKGGGTLVGDALFPDYITLRSDPLSPKLAASPWGFDLLPNRPMTWVEKGVVRNLYYDRYWASKAGKEPTPFPANLVLEGQDNSLEDLIRATDRGLLVTRFWYIRVLNPQTMQLTGLTRDGLFLIEDGKITAPVMNFRWNDSPVRLLQNTKKLGRPERIRGSETSSMLAPPLVATDFNFSSISDAV